MIFILEGHDLCGKSTAAARWSAAHNVPVVKPWADLSFARASLTSISRTLLSVAAVSGPLIFDRFITSEYVYGPMFGRDISYLDDLLGEWRDTVGGFCVIQCTLSEADLTTRYATRGDSNLSLEEVLCVRERYTNLPGLLPGWIDLLRCESFDGCVAEFVRRCAESRR